MNNDKRMFVINDPTVPRLSPSLACEIGLNESMVLMQIEHWIANSNNWQEGVKWTYQSVRDMQEKAFPFWSVSTIQRTVKSLLGKDYLEEGNFNQHAYDKTRWFALGTGLYNLKSITMVGGVGTRSGQNGTRSGQSGTRSGQSGTTIPDIPSDIPSDKKDIYTPIFEHWNKCKIRVHEKLTEKMKTKIKSTLKDYKPERIVQAISTYAYVLHNDEYFFSYTWSLDEFLDRGMSKFDDREVVIKNFKIKPDKKAPPPPKLRGTADVEADRQRILRGE